VIILNSEVFLQWSEERGYLNHDILSNNVLTELFASKSGLNAETQLPRLRLWLNSKKDFIDFIESTENATSPSWIIDEHYFNSWSDNQKTKYKTKFHELFLFNTGLIDKVKEAKMILERAHVLSEDLLRLVDDNASSEVIDSGLGNIINELQKLSEKISSFPRNSWCIFQK